MKYPIWVTAIAALTLGSCLASAHADIYTGSQPSMPETPVAAPPVADAVYHIAVNDVLSVNVAGVLPPNNLSTPQAVVTPDGNVGLPLIGTVHVVGLSTDQAAVMICQKLRKYLVTPSVSVGLVQKHIQQIIVGGFVAKPGPVTYLPDLHVLDVIAECGDVLPNADESDVTVTHVDKTSVTLNLLHPERKAHSDTNIPVQDGDIVYVPEQRGEFTVTGEVTKPGSYMYKPEMTVMDALTAASSTLPDADLEDTTLTRGGVNTPVNLNSLLRQGDMSQNLVLQPGDKITVPIGNRVYVYGAVMKPGFYTLVPGDRFLDALNAAGGPVQGPDYHANLSKITLIRVAPGRDRADIYPIRLADFTTKGDLSGNPLLQPKDVIWVGEKHSSTEWATAATGLLYSLNFINTGASVVQHGLGH